MGVVNECGLMIVFLYAGVLCPEGTLAPHQFHCQHASQGIAMYRECTENLQRICRVAAMVCE